MDLFSKTLVQDPRTERFVARVPELVGSWAGLMEGFDFAPIVNELITRASVAKTYPGSANMFKCFKECPFDDTKVVFIGQDPYYQPGIADGLAFSCGNTNKEQPSLKFIYDEIQRTAYHSNYVRTPSLVRWANQGVLLLNTALTVEAGRPDSHTELWAPFMRYVIPGISRALPDVVFVFVGSRAKAYAPLLKQATNAKFNIVHPAAAAHRGGQWDCEDIFNRVNQVLEAQNDDKIVW